MRSVICSRLHLIKRSVIKVRVDEGEGSLDEGGEMRVIR